MGVLSPGKGGTCSTLEAGRGESAPQKDVGSWVLFGLLHLIVFPVKNLYLTEFIPVWSVEVGTAVVDLARKPLGRDPLRDLKVVPLL